LSAAVVAAGLTFPAPNVVDMPVRLVVGDVELRLGTVAVELPARRGQGAAALANLLRAAAEVIAGRRHNWPRQAWWVGDDVRLPASVARGRVVQVDQHAKSYLVDVGGRRPVRVLWSEVDPVAAREQVDPNAVRAVLNALHAARVHA
jgi:hypothetical protein